MAQRLAHRLGRPHGRRQRDRPDGRWGIVDNRHVNLETGSTRVLAQNWKTTALSDDYTWGSDGAAILTAANDGVIVPSGKAPKENETLPVSGGVGSLALVTGSAAETHTLYALKRT